MMHFCITRLGRMVERQRNIVAWIISIAFAILFACIGLLVTQVEASAFGAFMLGGILSAGILRLINMATDQLNRLIADCEKI